LEVEEIFPKLQRIADEFVRKVQDYLEQTDLDANEKRLLTYATIASPTFKTLKSLPDDERTFFASKIIEGLFLRFFPEPEKRLALLGTNYIRTSIAFCKRDPQDMLVNFLACLCTITDHGVRQLPKRLHKDVYGILEEFFAYKRR